MISMGLLVQTLDRVEPDLIERLLRLTSARRNEMSDTDLAIDDCLRRRAADVRSSPDGLTT